MRIESLRDLLTQFPDIDGFWDFEDLPKTESKINQLLADQGESWTFNSLELVTQLARVQGLQGKLLEASSTLIRAKEIVSQSDNPKSKRAEIRYVLEQGRFLGLSMNPPQSLVYFTKAWELASKLGDVFFSIEAAFMLSISQPPKYRNEWLKKAIQIAESTDSEQGKLWLPILYVMDGWHYFDFRKYDAALTSFQKALERPQLPQDTARTFAIKWAVGRTLRALNKFQEALDIQKGLQAELSSAGKLNGHVLLEMAECCQLLKNPDEGQMYFEMAYKELSLDGWYSDNKALELNRIQHLSKKR